MINNYNKNIRKTNNIVSPIKIVNNKTSNPSLGANNSQSDEGWSIKQNAKRNLSSFTSEQNSPRESQPKPRKKIFASANRFEILASNGDQDSNQMDGLNDNPFKNTTTNTTTNTQTDNTNDPPIKPPPPIFVRGVEDFPQLFTVLIELIDVENFVCKSSTDRLKIQTRHLDAYRSLIRFLKEEKAEYHTY